MTLQEMIERYGEETVARWAFDGMVAEQRREYDNGLAALRGGYFVDVHRVAELTREGR